MGRIGGRNAAGTGRNGGTMAVEQFASNDPNARFAAAIMRALFRETYARDFALELWDGTIIPAERSERFRLVIGEAGALRAAFRPPVDLNAGRAFAAGLLECRGDVEAGVDALYKALESLRVRSKLQILALLARMPTAKLPALREAALRGRRHSVERDRAAIGFHYDQPVAFYRTFLGSELVYSCAYYDEGIETLEDAQLAKIDYILNKLRLSPGERLLDIGCGWGALVIRAAEKFGATAMGVTLSKAQAEESHRQIVERGLTDRASVHLLDYRQLPEKSFDKIASVGMFEHVGRAKLPTYFDTAYKLLVPGGLFLNHGIAEQGRERKGSPATGFIGHFVFPDGELVPVADALLCAEKTGFEIRDVENLREHYTRTLRAWVENLERHREEAIQATDETTYRVWRLYMAGSAQGFRTGRIGLFQALLAKPASDGVVSAIPPTRRDLYRDYRLPIATAAPVSLSKPL